MRSTKVVDANTSALAIVMVNSIAPGSFIWNLTRDGYVVDADRNIIGEWSEYRSCFGYMIRTKEYGGYAKPSEVCFVEDMLNG